MVIAVSQQNSKLSSNGVNSDSNGKLRNNLFQNPNRPPLLPSEAENGPNGNPRRPKSKEIASRYLSSSTSPCSSTSTTTSSSSNSSNYMTPRPRTSSTITRSVLTTPVPSVPNSNRRSQSAERRRLVTPRAVSGDTSNARKLLMTSTRSFSVSFQGEPFSVLKSTAKPATVSSSSASMRKETPERRKKTPARDQRENLTSKLNDQYRWPVRSRSGNSSFCTKSLDLGALAEKARESGSARAPTAMQKSMMDDNKRNIAGIKLDSNYRHIELEKKVDLVPRSNSAISAAFERAASDSDSTSSGSCTSLQECGSAAQPRGGPGGIVVPARVWQETFNRLQRGSEPGSPVLRNNGSKFTGASKLIGAKKCLNDVPASSPRNVSSGKGLSSPLRGSVRPASPSKVFSSSINSAARGTPSPIRMRNAALNNNVGSTPSILSFGADVRRGKMGETMILDAHELRLLYNRHLQWRFVNAQAETSLMAQTELAERSLYNAWVTTSKLQHSVKSKRMELQLLNHNLKLCSILNGQVPSLEDWDIIERDLSNSLLGATEALETRVVRLPVVDGARVDIQEVKNALYSAVDVMQTMASSTGSLLTKVEQVNMFISELSSMALHECELLSECKDLLSKLTSMEVKDCSLRAHILQLNRMV